MPTLHFPFFVKAYKNENKRMRLRSMDTDMRIQHDTDTVTRHFKKNLRHGHNKDTFIKI